MDWGQNHSDRLSQAGLEIYAPGETIPPQGFAVPVESPRGETWTLRSHSPFLLDNFDPTRVGIARVNDSGFVTDSWGLAVGPAGLKPGDSIVETPFGEIYAAAQNGRLVPQLVGWVKCFASLQTRSGAQEVLLMLVDAEDEEIMRRRARQSHRAACALSRLGKVLGMNHGLRPLAAASCHAIYSALDLSAVVLWTSRTEGGSFEYAASAGLDQEAISAIEAIDLSKIQCAASLSASQMQPLFLRRLDSSPLASEFEGRITGGRGEGLYVSPLIIGGRAFGIIELIAKQGDGSFAEGRDLYSTITEHISLAINRAQVYEKAERLAAYDPLTSIANHRTLHQTLEQRTAECARNGGSLGVVMIDVDHFRQFNEEEGHAAGDEVLRMVATVLQDNIRSYDMAARYGGEEFTLILPSVEREEVFEMAEKVRTALCALVYQGSSGAARQVTASFGCAIYGELKSAGDLLIAADLALYKAKRAGRNRTEFFDGLLPTEHQVEAA